MSGGDASSRARKDAYFARLLGLLDSYQRIILVIADNVGSNHMQQIRASLRDRAVILMGKNTLIRKAIRTHLDNIPALEALLPHIWGNVGLVFTNEDTNDIRQELVKNKVQASAKAGVISPVDVIVPAGGTGQEPTKTSFFQALSIPTKIMKGAIEIINDVSLIKAGDRVSPSQAVLLQMMDIKPFQYGLKVTVVYDDGIVYDAKLLDLTDDDVLKRFHQGVANVAALSLQIGYPTMASLPHSVLNAYKNLIAITLETDYTFKGAEKIKEMLSDPAKLAAAMAAQQAVPTEAAPTETKKVGGDEDKDPDDDGGDDGGGMGDLFGGEDDDAGGGMGGLFGGEDD